MKRFNYVINFAALIVGLLATQTIFADVKIKARQTVSGQTTENTTYIKGKRIRSEQNVSGMQTINLTQCDLKRGVRIMPQSEAYMIDSWQTAQSVAPTTTTQKTQSVNKGGVITMTVTTKDTGERKQMFGYTAKHLITTMETSSSPDACGVNKSKMEIDGWYIDAAFALNCEVDQYVGYRQDSTKSGCQDRYETKQIGKAKSGYPVLEKMTMYDDSGRESFTMLNEVLELTSATLDATLFDIPNGYREVKDSTELYASMGGQSSVSKNSRNNYNINDAAVSNKPALASSVKTESQPISNLLTVVGAKKEGVMRIGLAGVKTGAIGEGLDAAELAGVVQNTLAEFMKTPNVELVALEGKIPSVIDAEAKTKECDFIILSNVSHKKGGGGFGMFKKLAPVLSNVTPLGGMSGSVAGAVAGQVASTVIYTAAGMAEKVKAKDEITLDLKVNSIGGSSVLSRQFKQKAKGDGDDIITPIIEQAAQAILNATVKR